MVETALPRRSALADLQGIWLASGQPGWPFPAVQYARIWLRQRPVLAAVVHWGIAPGAASGPSPPTSASASAAMLDAVVAELYGLDWSDLAYILRDCDHPAERMRASGFSRGLDPKGFWRVDKGQDPELRHTVLTLAAFQDLKDTIARVGSRERGIAAFTQQHDGDGWMLPETLCLADLGLGHDERARKPQPVRARLGERFLPWQLEQTPEESWAECERHARNLLGETEFRRLQRELAAEEREERRVAEEPGEYRVDRQPGLWDDEGGGS